jgi:arylsulfatase A-like enzyme
VRLRDHIALAWATGALVGAVEVARSLAWDPHPGDPHGLLLVVLGSALAGLGGALFGVFQGVGLALLGHAKVGAAGLLPQLFGADRAARVARRASLVGFGGALIAYAIALWLSFGRLAAVEDPGLVEALRVAVAAGGGALTLLLGGLLAGLLRAPLEALDERRPFPWIGSGAGRRLLVSGLVGAVALAVLGDAGDRLGPLAWAPFVVLFLCAEVYLAEVTAGLLRRRGEGGGRMRSRLMIGLAALSALPLGIAEAGPAIYRDLDETRAPRLGRGLLRELTDVDRDGFSSLFGGGDCGPLDGAVSPLATDVPGNGVDENCDGVDAAPGGIEEGLEPYLGLRPPLEVDDYDVVWIIVDALRSDHVSGLGYRQLTTPYLDQFADESLVFTSAYSQSSATMLSIPSMLSGRDPLAATWEVEAGKLALSPTVPTLSERLAARGYRSSMIVTSYIHQRLPGIFRGYDEVVDSALRLPKTPGGRRASASTADAALAFVHRLFPDPEATPPPYLLTVYFEDPHMPYSPREPGYTRFKGPHRRYDQEIQATDRHIGSLLDGLRLSPRWDRTIVIITADHGEEFKEHGGRFHARTCYEESVHVPLFVRIPGIAPARIDAPVALVDILPTLVELLGLRRDIAVDGQSLLFPALEPARVSPERPIFCAVLSQKPSQGHFLREAVRSGHDLLVHEVIDGRYELFDRREDPGEHAPRALTDAPAKAVYERLRARLEAARRGNLRQRLLTR